MQFYNTKTRKKEEFKPLSSREVKIYYCGPTVYNYAHIWNLSTFIFEDIVVKTLKFLWYNVKTVMNITDVDDKTIRDSQKAWEKLLDFTRKYTDIFLSDIEKLWIQKADEIVPVTDLIPEMVRMINTMLKRKNAYLSEDGSIYFDVKSFKKYWKFANLDMSKLKDWVRIDNDEYDKDSASDFVLWKAWKKEDWDNFWEEEFEIPSTPAKAGPPPNPLLSKEGGESKTVKIKWRPGWHIECSACNIKHFGPQIDIHMWWVDLVFPHHQNEIAQTESCTRKEFSKYWLHSWHILVDWKKMSKSLWNFYTLKDIEDKYILDKNSPLFQRRGAGGEVNSILYRAVRFSFINWKYNTQREFNFDKLETNFNTIKWIDELLKLVDREIQKGDKEFSWVSKEFSDYLQEVTQEYIYHLEDDFNIPEALAVFFNLSKYINTNIRENNFSLEELKALVDLFKTFNQVLGIFDFDILDWEKEEIPSEILEKLEERNKAKKEKNFELADKLRDEITESWYKIIDSREGSFLEKI